MLKKGVSYYTNGLCGQVFVGIYLLQILNNQGGQGFSPYEGCHVTILLACTSEICLLGPTCSSQYEIRKFGPIWLLAIHFTSPAITRLVPSTSRSHLWSSRIRHFPHFSMKSPRIATVLAKVANSPRCGEILCKQYHCTVLVCPITYRVVLLTGPPLNFLSTKSLYNC